MEKESRAMVRASLLFTILVTMAGCTNPTVQKQRPIGIIAHRGAHAEAPENSLAAIRKAIELGLDYVEVDVRTTKDGRLVLSHDRSLQRATGVDALVAEETLAEVEKLSIGLGRGRDFEDERVPTFEEALEFMSGRIGVYVDNKEADPQKVVALLEEYHMVESSVIYSNNSELAKFLKLNPRLTVMPEVDSVEELEQAGKLKPRVVAQVWKGFSEELVASIHARGMKVYLDILGAGDNPQGVRRALAAGVDAIQTNDPEMVLRTIDSSE